MKKILVLMAISLVLVGCFLFPKKVDVEYFVSCTAIPNLVKINYTEDGEYSELLYEPTPWTYTFESRSRTWVEVIAWNLQDHGTVTAIIYIDGVLLDGDTTPTVARACGPIP